MRVCSLAVVMLLCCVSLVAATQLADVKDDIATLLGGKAVVKAPVNSMQAQGISATARAGMGMRFTEQKDSTQASAPAGDQLAAALTGMLNKEKKQNEDTFKALFLQQKSSLAADQSLEAERSKVHQHAVFLEQLQICLNEKETAEKVQKEKAELDQMKSAFVQQRDEIVKDVKEVDLKDKTAQAAFEQAIDEDNRLAKAIKMEEAKLALLEEKGSKSLSHAKMVDMSEEQLQQRAKEVEEQQVRLHQKRDQLHATIKDMKHQQMRFMEVRESQRNQFIKESEGRCVKAKTCGECSAISQCGWCESTNKCLIHHVNSKHDGLVSNKCPTADWRSKVSDTLTSLNFNVFGYDSTDAEQRANSIFNVIIAANYPDFVAMQEVSTWYYDRLMQQSFVQKYYHVSNVTDMKAPAGLLLLSRFPITKTAYIDRPTSSDKARKDTARVLMIESIISGRVITVATALLDYESADTRVAGLDFINKVTIDAENLIFMGDVNFDDAAQPETENIPVHWMDLWPTLHKDGEEYKRGPNRSGATWDPSNNWYAYTVDQNSKSSRIDRIFLRSPYLLATSVWNVGCPGPDYLCLRKTAEAEDGKKKKTAQRLNPSSHFGQLAKYSLFLPTCANSIAV